MEKACLRLRPVTQHKSYGPRSVGRIIDAKIVAFDSIAVGLARHFFTATVSLVVIRVGYVIAMWARRGTSERR